MTDSVAEMVGPGSVAIGIVLWFWLFGKDEEKK